MPGIIPAPSLSRLTTLGLGGQALALARAEDEHSLEALPEILRRLGGKPVPLGRGSNILAADGELPLVLLAFGPEKTEGAGEKVRLLREEAGEALVEAPAWLPLSLLLERLADLGLGGLTGLSGIPGRLGGAIAMNAGSFGDDLKSRLEEARVFSPLSGLVRLRAEELDMGYRRCRIPSLENAEWFIFTGAVLRCPRMAPEEARARLRDCLEEKKRSQPLGARSAGCVFKNPPEGAAGKFLDEAGFRGKSRGGLCFSALHANFLLNNGMGRAIEAFELIEEAREAVHARFEVRLELEVKVWV
jgi:UDP-N-acetylmuramate dehydrogenase